MHAAGRDDCALAGGALALPLAQQDIRALDCVLLPSLVSAFALPAAARQGAADCVQRRQQGAAARPAAAGAGASRHSGAFMASLRQHQRRFPRRLARAPAGARSSRRRHWPARASGRAHRSRRMGRGRTEIERHKFTGIRACAPPPRVRVSPQHIHSTSTRTLGIRTRTEVPVHDACTLVHAYVGTFLPTRPCTSEL